MQCNAVVVASSAMLPGVLFVACGVYHSIFTVLEQMLLIVIVSSAVVRTSDHHNQQHMTMNDGRTQEQYGAIIIMK